LALAFPTFEDYVRSRGPALLRLAFMLCGDEILAEDLTQDVLLRACGRWRRLSNLDHPDPYVKRMLVNGYVSWSRRRSSSEIPAGAEIGARQAPGEPDKGDLLAAREVAWRLLATLPRRQRAVLVLRFYEDLADPEIAAVLGCTPSTVRSQASRALAALRSSPQLRDLLQSTTPFVQEGTP
jgi:RNA polymerase sigma-70 factor (sigma-E family)